MEQAGPPADLVEMFALPIPSLVICDLLGVPYEDRARFHEQAAVVVDFEASAEEGATAYAAITEFFQELIERKRIQPEDDLLSGLVSSGELNDDELIGAGTLLLVAGHETTANMLSLGTFALLAHPAELEHLRADPSLLGNAVEELLRYLSITQFGPARTALEDLELGGCSIRAGETVVVSLPAANRDRDRFAEPDTLDLRRDASGHLAFGHGVHSCIGQQLARLEMQFGYSALFGRFPTLRLAIPPERVRLKYGMPYGVHELPVTW
jgi:cytochrome P450